MKIGAEDKKKLGVAIGAGVLAIGAAFYLYSELATPDVPPPVATAPVVVSAPSTGGSSQTGGAGNRTAKNAGTAAALDPTLKMGPMLVTESLVYSGSGRNIFSANSVQATIPKPIAPVRPKLAAAYVPPVPTGPAGPPPIDLKFFGTATLANGNREAFLLRGDDVFLASPGDIVQRRYRVIAVRANSIEVEDMANSNTQTLPLLVN